MHASQGTHIQDLQSPLLVVSGLAVLDYHLPLWPKERVHQASEVNLEQAIPIQG